MFYGNYNKPGKGVSKDEANQPLSKLFWAILSRNFGKLVKLNILHLLFSVPFIIITMLCLGYISTSVTSLFTPILSKIYSLELGSGELFSVTATVDLITRLFLSFVFMCFLEFGPIATGFTYVIHNYTREHHVYLLSDIFDNIKSNMKQSSIMWIIDIVMCFVLYVSFVYYNTTAHLAFIECFLIIVMIHYLMMHFYIYPIMTRFDLPLKYILKNSLILTVTHFFKNLLLLTVNIIIHLVLPLALAFFSNTALAITIYILLEILFLPMLTKFTYMFFTRDIIDKTIVNDK